MTKKAIDALMSIGIDIGKDTFRLVCFYLDGHSVNLGLTANEITVRA